MPKTCIICGNPAGSGEHVFPAAFGGRRTNNGIYCEADNNALGSHVAALLESLDIMNAIVGVRPDRHDTVRPAIATAEDGESYLVAKNTISLAPPPPLDKNVNHTGEQKNYRFASQQQADEWIAQQRKNGFEISATSGEVKTTYFTEPLLAKKTIGGEEFRRGVAYLALTFLAHHFPDAARARDLESIKSMIMEKSPFNDEAWWLDSNALANIPVNPFATGHTVVIALSRDTGLATALVSFFGAINFGVNLGKVNPSENVRLTTHINPLAEKPPGDIVTVREDGVRLELGSLEEGRSYLKAVVAGEISNPFLNHTARAGAAQLDDMAERLLEPLLAAGRLSGFKRREEIARLMSGERQRILNLLHSSITGFAEHAKELPPVIHAITGTLIAKDSERDTGLSSQAEVSLEVAKSLVGFEIERRLTEGTFDRDALKDILGGPGGVALIFANLVKPLIESTIRS